MEISGIGAVRWIAQHREHFCLRNILLDLLRCFGEIKVENAGFPDRFFILYAIEQRRVLFNRGDDAAMIGAVLVMGPMEKPARTLAAKKRRLLGYAHEHLRMLIQIRG